MKKKKKHVLMIGATGTGKTILAQSLLKELPENHSQLSISFSATTTSLAVQEIIEGSMEKRSKDKLGPHGGKSLVIFVDDFNMPKRTSTESPFQPPLELIRLWIDYQGWYDRARCSWKFVLDSQLLAAMGHPGGGRNPISSRTLSRFSVVNLAAPAGPQVVRIFEAILSSKFNDYENEIKQLASGIAVATFNVYKAVSSDFLVTPEKFHYLL
jgi:dynein heavy chain